MAVQEIGLALFQLGFDTNYIRNYLKNKGRTFMHNCEVCGKPDSEKPMAFRNKPWCNENHRKVVQNDKSVRKTY